MIVPRSVHKNGMLVVISLWRLIKRSPGTKGLLIGSLIFKDRPDCVGSTRSKTVGRAREGSLQLHYSVIFTLSFD